MLLISDKLYLLLKIVHEKLVNKKYFANFADQNKKLNHIRLCIGH